jgi:hypothetical protein
VRRERWRMVYHILRQTLPCRTGIEAGHAEGSIPESRWLFVVVLTYTAMYTAIHEKDLHVQDIPR